jgi:hypothetical protein
VRDFKFYEGAGRKLMFQEGPFLAAHLEIC